MAGTRANAQGSPVGNCQISKSGGLFFSPETFFRQALPVFMKCLLSAFMLRDRLFCLSAAERFPLSCREAGIGAFSWPPIFSFTLSIATGRVSDASWFAIHPSSKL
jgi:hypothetical protein